MRVEIRERNDSDVRAGVDRELPPGEVLRDGSELRVRHRRRRGGDGLRAAAAGAATRRCDGRAARSPGAWTTRSGFPPRSRCARSSRGRRTAPTTPACSRAATTARPGSTLALDAPAELRGARRAADRRSPATSTPRAISRTGPPNDLNLRSRSPSTRRACAGGHLTVESLRPRLDRGAGDGCVRRRRAGSAEDPQLIVMRYDPPARRADVTLGLVGKAITFDSGGISLKPQLRMQDMKGDMCRRRSGDRGDGRDRRARPAGPRPHRRRLDREHAGRQRVQARRHPARVERQDDRDHQHRRRRPARPRRRAALRAIERRDAPHRLRHADRRDVGRARRPLRRLVLRTTRRSRRRSTRPQRRAATSPGASRSTRATAATSTPTSPT